MADAGDERGAEARRRRLEEAALRLGDPIMPECYDDWIAEIRRRAAALRCEILTRLTEAAEAEGNRNAVIRYARWRLDADPS